MSTRDELARSLCVADKWGVPQAGTLWDKGEVAPWLAEGYFRRADALIAEGWRKRPSEAELVRALMNAEVFVNDGDGQWEAPMEKEAERIATTVLALMDRGQ